MTVRKFALCLSLILVAGIASAEVIPFDLEIGYRFLNLKGNEGMYRTQINERDGLYIRAFTLTNGGTNGSPDHYRIDVSDLGQTPSGLVRIDAGRSGAYRLLVNYRRSDAFSALPVFANPLIVDGVTTGQHTFSRTRNLFDADLEFLPGSRFTPFVGYSWNRYGGPGETTYFLGQDEFQLFSNPLEKDQEIRGGFSFNTGHLYGSVTQGWRNFHGTDSLSLVAPGTGNNTLPILGTTPSATQLSRHTRTDVKTPFTNAYVTSALGSRVKLIGNYTRFAADTTGTEGENGVGSFVSFPLSRFFSGLSEDVTSHAKNTSWRGGGRAEIVIVPGVDFLAGWQREHRDLEGTALINTLFLQSITFGGADKKDLATALNATNSLGRTEDVLSATVNARALGPFALRFGYSQTKQEVSVTPDLSEIVVAGGQGGTFSRRVNTFDSLASFSKKGFTVAGAWRHDDANDPIFRTDFVNRDRYRVRATWRAPKYIRLGTTAEQTKQTNNQPGIGFDSNIRQYAGDVEFAPVTPFVLRASASQYKGDTNMLFREPENFRTGTSIHSENGVSWEGGANYTFKKANIDADVIRFDNKGSTPFRMDRFRARFAYDFTTKVGIATEFSKDKYTETPFLFGDYDANRIGIFLRLRP
ncbi:MAG TPA: hypothetical protein VF980_11245 [Thermoanaerobaculia bacterium]